MLPSVQIALATFLLATSTCVTGFSFVPAVGIVPAVGMRQFPSISSVSRMPALRHNSKHPRLSPLKMVATPESVVTSQSQTTENEDKLLTREHFDFMKQWYPMAVIEFLDEKKPHPIQLMGKELVIWKDLKEGKWQVFEDACPHRLAPLSEGRVEPDGTLLCAYHAWRFEASGACIAIPHAPVDREQDMCKLPKACAVSYPVQEAQGLLWVWGTPGAPGSDAALEASLKPPALIPELEDPKLKGRVNRLTWSVRDLPYGWDYFIENVLDPAHVTVSHHGIVGNRYKDPKYFNLQTVEGPTAAGGFKQLIIDAGPANTVNSQRFLPPSSVQIENEYPGGGKFKLALYASPTVPGWSRHIGCQVLVANDDGTLPPGLGFFALPMPIWLQHVLASLFLHQDAVFLHHQEKILARRGYMNSAGSSTSTYDNAVFTPTPQDKGIILFRKWLQYSAGGGVPWAPGTPPLGARETDKAILFDVYNTHTKHCKVCMAALQNLKLLRMFLGAACLAVVALSKGPVALAAGGFFAVAALAVHKLIKLFYRYEFNHSDND